MIKKLQYNVCVAREYIDGSGSKKTHFWNVGKAYPFENANGKKGVTVKLWSRTLMVDELVLFEDTGADRVARAVQERPNQQDDDTPDDADIPF